MNLEQVARRAKVSTATVSRVLNNASVVKTATSNRVMKAIEERMGGTYSPSPGVIYPTLAWLEDMRYAAVETEDAGRKRYRITAEGEALLTANRAAVDDLLARLGQTEGSRRDGIPAPVLRAMENLKLSLRLRLRRGALDPAAAEAIASALDAAAQTVERS